MGKQQIVLTGWEQFFGDASFFDRLKSDPYFFLLCLGILINILVLIIGIVCLAKISLKNQNRQKTNNYSINSPVDNVLSQIALQEERNLMNDQELVAVITAAISAYTSGSQSTDGFVVRSIRKVNTNRR